MDIELKDGMTLEQLVAFNEDAVTKFEKKEITSLDYYNRRMFTLIELSGPEGMKLINDRLQGIWG